MRGMEWVLIRFMLLNLSIEGVASSISIVAIKQRSSLSKSHTLTIKPAIAIPYITPSSGVPSVPAPRLPHYIPHVAPTPTVICLPCHQPLGTPLYVTSAG